MLDMNELYWAAGFIEGEGCFHYSRGLMVTANQVQRQPLERIQKLFGGTIIPVPKPRPGQRDQHCWRIQDGRAAGVMMTLWPLMSPWRQEQIQKRLDAWKAKPLASHLHMRVTGQCKRGHEMTPENTGALKGGRHRFCKICWRVAHAKAEAARRKRYPERSKLSMRKTREKKRLARLEAAALVHAALSIREVTP